MKITGIPKEKPLHRCFLLAVILSIGNLKTKEAIRNTKTTYADIVIRYSVLKPVNDSDFLNGGDEAWALVDFEKLERKIADEKKKQEAEARRLEVEKKKKIAYEKKKQEARKKLQELTEKIENKYKSRFEKEKIKAIEIVKKESANELQKQKFRHAKELEKLSDEIAELRTKNTLLKNKLHQNQTQSGPSERTDTCFYCSNWAIADKKKKPANPCEQQRERGSYYCEHYQPDSSILKLTPAKKLDKLTDIRLH